MSFTRIAITAALTALLAASGCVSPGYNLPPAHRLAAPGPGVDGPGPGVLGVGQGGMIRNDGGAGAVSIVPSTTTAQVMFVKPAGMHVYYDTTATAGYGNSPIVVPGRLNFPQAGLYRMKITNIEGHEGVELYPTIEVGPPNPRTLAFLSHNTIPVQLTVDDFNQVLSSNFVTKVIYLPDPEFQELAVAGVETLVSTRLDAGLDPIVEADRRGAILAVVRIGNKDMEMPDSQGASPASAMPVSFQGAMPGPAGVGMGGGPMGPVGGGMVAGGNMPQYGMPITATPIGLPGPPHIPLGGPAGLQKHVIRNHTPTYIPDPTKKIKIHVKQMPAVRYPEPASRAWIKQYNLPNCGPNVGAGSY